MAHTATHRAASDARKPSAYTNHIAEELQRYGEHLRDVRGLAEGTCRQRARNVGHFLHEKFAGRPINISELRAEDVRRFLASQLDARRIPSELTAIDPMLPVKYVKSGSSKRHLSGSCWFNENTRKQ